MPIRKADTAPERMCAGPRKQAGREPLRRAPATSEAGGGMDRRGFLLWCAGLTLLIEAVTLVLRFGVGLESSRETASVIGPLMGGIRIHHGYIGVLLMGVAAGIRVKSPRIAAWVLLFGAALTASDLIHHFLVLWPLTGSPEFHLIYPRLHGS